MQRQIDLEIEKLRKKILSMGESVEQAIEAATQGLLDRDPEQLKKVQSIENKINQYHLEVDNTCLTLIASQSPLAADLRMILAIIKINADLERMGDQAVNISFNAGDYLKNQKLEQVSHIVGMSKAVREMVAESMVAFSRSDVAMSEAVLKKDDIVDEGKRTIFKSLVQAMKSDPEAVDSAVDLMLVSRNLERMGDHATNIAEDVIFACTGKDIRHGGFSG